MRYFKIISNNVPYQKINDSHLAIQKILGGNFTMRTFKIVIKETNELENIFCNMCGKKIPVNEFGQMQDFLQIEKQWDYHSFHDGKTHKIDICISCYEKIIQQFKISVT